MCVCVCVCVCVFVCVCIYDALGMGYGRPFYTASGAHRTNDTALMTHRKYNNVTLAFSFYLSLLFLLSFDMNHVDTTRMSANDISLKSKAYIPIVNVE